MSRNGAGCGLCVAKELRMNRPRALLSATTFLAEMQGAKACAALAARRKAFRSLHERGCFVIPNPWDVGSARYLESLGFPALATTSSGFAWSRGRADNGVTMDDALRHFEDVAMSVDIPVNGDFEGGFAVDPTKVAAHVRRAVATGIAGVSIEDSTGDGARPLLEFALAVERVRAAAQAVAGSGVLLTARSEGFIV